jgi:hypothetical protein
MIAIFAGAMGAHAQAVPAASQALPLSIFGTGTANFTGLNGGRNLALTAGVDLALHPRFSLYPALEVRGTYAFYGGQVDSQKNIMGGIKLSAHYGHLHPYANILVGQGEITYENGGFPNPSGTYQYLQTDSLVISPGLGADYEISEHFAIKGDFQLQHYKTPVTASGSLYAKPISVGIVYRLHFRNNGH